MQHCAVWITYNKGVPSSLCFHVYAEAAPDFNDKGTGRYDPGPNDDDDHHDAHRQDNRRYSIVETTSRTNTYAGSVAGTLCDWASLARNSPITMVPPTDGLNEAEVARKGDECGTKDTHSEHDSWPDVDKKSILGMGYGGDEDRSSPLPQIVGLPRVEDLPLGEGWDDAGNDISKIRNEVSRLVSHGYPAVGTVPRPHSAQMRLRRGQSF